MTPDAQTISRRYIAADIRSRPLPRNSIDLAGLGFVADAREEESTQPTGEKTFRDWLIGQFLIFGVGLVDLVARSRGF